MTYQALAMTMGERLSYSGKMLVIGMGTVLLALSLLWLVLTLFRFVAVAPKGKKKKAPTIVREATPPAEAVTPIIVPSNDDAIVAVITAAVAATLAAENGGAAKGFRVVSFRRADQNK